MKKKVFTILSLLLFITGKAQVDAHFSQYYAHPLWLNPAMTGAFDGKLRVTAIYRSQWNSINDPFVTSGLSADVVTGKNLNIGFSVLNQTAGTAGYRYMNGSLSFTYSGIHLGEQGTQHVMIGMQIGLLNRRFDATKFQFGDQWNPSTGFDPTSPSVDVLSKTAASSFDAGAGIAWLDATPEKKVNPFAGFSLLHLTRPYDPFINGNKAFLPFRYAVHGGARIMVSENATLTPNILYLRQGNAEEKMVGATANLSVNESTDLLFGMNYRIGDAISPMAGLRYQNFTLGLSYDNTISNLSKTAGKANSFEISISFTTPKSEYKGIPCPKF